MTLKPAEKRVVQSEQVGQSSWNGNAAHVRWIMKAGDEGEPVSFSGFSKRSVQFSGSFGGAKVQLEGSNDLVDPSHWVVLRNDLGDRVAKSENGIDGFSTMTIWVRPTITGGDETTAISVNLYVSRS